MYNTQSAEDDATILVYRELLRTARQILSDHEASIKQKALLRVEDPRLKAFIQNI